MHDYRNYFTLPVHTHKKTINKGTIIEPYHACGHNLHYLQGDFSTFIRNINITELNRNLKYKKFYELTRFEWT